MSEIKSFVKSDGSPEPNSFDDFSRRFQELASEAQRYGIQAVAMIMDSNPIDRSESKEIIWRGGAMAAIGLLTWARHLLLTCKRIPEDDNA